MKRFKFVPFVYILLGMTFLVFSSSIADPSDQFKALLINISGWEAGSADGANVNMGGMKLTTANRSYDKNDLTIDVTLIAGSNMLVQGQVQGTNVETDDAKVETKQIDGFTVIQGTDKTTNDGYVIVTLVTGTSEGAMLLVSYESVEAKTALEFAKKFNWKKMKDTATPLVK